MQRTRRVVATLIPVPCVRRGKARIFSGCNSRPATLVAPAGSNRSGDGGNETAGAFDAKGRSGDSANRQAVTRVNAEQASKGAMWEPTRHKIGEGRSRWGDGGYTPRSDRNQFRLGQVHKAYQAVDRHTCHRLRQWLRYKHQSPTLGYSRYSNESLHERLGLVRLKGRRRNFSWANA